MPDQTVYSSTLFQRHEKRKKRRNGDFESDSRIQINHPRTSQGSTQNHSPFLTLKKKNKETDHADTFFFYQIERPRQRQGCRRESHARLEPGVGRQQVRAVRGRVQNRNSRSVVVCARITLRRRPHPHITLDTDTDAYTDSVACMV